MKYAPLASLAAMTLLALIAPLAAQDARILNTHDTPLEWAYLDRVKSGENIPTTVQTLSVNEANFYGLDTGFGDLDEPTMYGRLSVQPYAMGWSGIDLTRNTKNASLLERVRLDDPVLAAGVSFGAKSFFATTQLDFSTDSLARYADEDGMSGIWKPGDYLSYWTFPEEGYLAWSLGPCTLAAGRLRSGIGLGDSNIFMNGDARWYDQLQFSWWSKRFHFYTFLATSSSHLDDTEYAIQSFTDSDGDDSFGWDVGNNHDASTQSVVPYKMFTYHRLEFRPISRLGIGLAEMQLVGGKVPDMTNLLPVVAWHNTYSAGVSNVMLQADVWAVPLKGVLVYGEFVMDDSRAPSESRASKPNCWAWELGTTWVLPIDSADWRFSLNAEYSHADRWTYNRWQPYLTMYQRQMITGGHTGYDIPLGHPEGGDVDQVGLRFTALTRDGKRVEAGYTWICKGPVYLGMTSDTKYDVNGDMMYVPVYYDYDDYAGSGALDKLLGNTRKISHVFNVNASWPLPKNLEANAGVDFRYIVNAEHEAGKTAIETFWKTGIKWSYDKSKAKKQAKAPAETD